MINATRVAMLLICALLLLLAGCGGEYRDGPDMAQDTGSGPPGTPLADDMANSFDFDADGALDSGVQTGDDGGSGNPNETGFNDQGLGDGGGISDGEVPLPPDGKASRIGRRTTPSGVFPGASDPPERPTPIQPTTHYLLDGMKAGILRSFNEWVIADPPIDPGPPPNSIGPTGVLTLPEEPGRGPAGLGHPRDGDGDNKIDEEPVPEPSTVILMLLGMATLYFIHRRR